jgi:uncharacterized RDD family membrane protein YckC
MEKYKTFIPRFIALSIDIFIFLPLAIFDEWIKEANLLPTVKYLWLPVLNLAFPIYSLVMIGLYGQTLGKMAAKVKVLDLTESPVTFRQAFLRELPQLFFNTCAIFIVLPAPDEQGQIDFSANVVGTVLFALSLIWSLADILVFVISDKGRALHDYIAGTVVVKTDFLEKSEAAD